MDGTGENEALLQACGGNPKDVRARTIPRLADAGPRASGIAPLRASDIAYGIEDLRSATRFVVDVTLRRDLKRRARSVRLRGPAVIDVAAVRERYLAEVPFAEGGAGAVTIAFGCVAKRVLDAPMFHGFRHRAALPRSGDGGLDGGAQPSRPRSGDL